MKNRTFAMICLVLVLALVASVVVACNVVKYDVTFDMGGVAENVTLSGEAGAELVAPSASDTDEWYFGGWYENASFEGEPVVPNKFGSKNVTYFAKWYVRYSVDVLLQNDSLDDYEKSEELSYGGEFAKGSVPEYVDVTLPPVTGYGSADADELRFSLEGKNTVKQIKLDILDVPVNYHYNVVDEYVPEDYSDVYKYGRTAKIDDSDLDFALMRELGYRYVGLSYTSDGEELIEDGAEATMTAPVDVYAIWDKAYEDRAGGVDYIYLPKREPGKIYFDRYGYENEIEGTYDAATGICRFTLLDGVTYEAKLYDDGTFQTDRAHNGKTITLYDPKSAATVDGLTLTFGNFDSVTVNIPDGSEELFYTLEYQHNARDDSYFITYLSAGEHRGTYTYDVVFEDLLLNVDGHAFHLKERSDDTFIMRGIEAGYYLSDSDDFIAVLDGYGMYADSDNDSGAYTVKSETRVNFGGELVTQYRYVFLVTVSLPGYDAPTLFTCFDDSLDLDDDGVEDDAFLGTMVESDGYQGDFKYYNTTSHNTTDRAMLSLDGFGTATMASRSYDYQFLYEEIIGATNLGFVKLTGSDESTDDCVVLLDYYGANSSREESYIRFTKDARIYALTQIDDLSSKQPFKVLVIDEDNIYVLGLDSSGNAYALAQSGTVDFNIADGVYIATVTNVDGSAETSFKFYTADMGGVEIALNYIDSGSEGNASNKAKTYNGVYTSAEGCKIKLDAFGNAEFTDPDGRTHIGDYFYSPKFDQCTFICSELWYRCVMFNFTVDEEAESFGYKMTLDGELAGKTYYYGPKSNGYRAIAQLKVGNDGEAEIWISTGSEFVKMLFGKVQFEDPYYYHFKFIPNDAENAQLPSQYYDYVKKVPELASEFTFGFIYAGDTVYFELVDEYIGMYEVSYRSEKVTFYLDGFENAIAMIGDKVYGGFYQVTEQQDGLNQFRFMSEDDEVGSLYFDEVEEGVYVMRDAEYIPGGYYLTDLMDIYQYKFIPDGHGKAIIALSSDAGLISMGEGRYVINDSGVGKVSNIEFVTWTVDEEEGIDADLAKQLNDISARMRNEFGLGNDFEFTLVTMTYGNRDMECFIMHKPEWAKIIVMADGSVLETNGIYSALYIDPNGDAYRGQYYVETYDDGEEGGISYQVIRFLERYGKDMTFLIEEDGVRQVGNEFGMYTLLDNDALEEVEGVTLYLDGEGNAIYVDGEHTHTGTYEHILIGVIEDDGTDAYYDYIIMTVTQTDGEPVEATLQHAFHINTSILMFVVDDEILPQL